jgi:hypothetical protein
MLIPTLDVKSTPAADATSKVADNCSVSITEANNIAHHAGVGEQMLARLAGKVRALVQRTVPPPEGGEQQAGGGVLLAQPLVLGRPGQDLLLPCLELRHGRPAIATATE